MNNYYHVIWIDDEWELMTSFKTNCRLKYRIELTPFKTQKEGLDAYALNPQYWEAIILDAKVLDESVNERPDIKSLQKAITRINKEFDVPYFISTGQPDFMSDSMFESLFSYYKKGADDERLCNDILSTIKDKPARRIRDKYADVFSWYPNPNELIEILKYVEENRNTDPSVFNLIRKELDWLLSYCNECGILLTQFNGSNQNECSRDICNSRLHDYVPEFIQRAFHSTIVISNNGSHRLEIDKCVKEGKAPYLVQSTIFEFMNIIMWASNLPTDTNIRALLREEITKISTKNN